MARRQALLLTTRPDNGEMEELVYALGADLVGTVHQRRERPDPQWFLGSGKIAEVRDLLRASGIDLVVVAGELKAGQIHTLQTFLSEGRAPGAPAVEVFDRVRLILEIFQERARSPEARLQVELARLHYEMPLVKEYIHLAKKGEHPGFLGGGEYEVNNYYDMMKKRMARIRHDLAHIEAERAVRRKHRRRGGFHLVSLAGYTNAGKSSLLRALSDRDTLVENRYFSTLGTTTARARSDKREILVTDTVGFIEDLPPWLVRAFHSTLEEIAVADVVLLVVDASDPPAEVERRLASSLRILAPAARQEGRGDPEATGAARLPKATGGPTRGAPPARPTAPWTAGAVPLLVVLNKTDRMTPDAMAALRERLAAKGLVDPARVVEVSARARLGLDALYDRIYALLPDHERYDLRLPATPEAEAFVAWLHEHTDVLAFDRAEASPSPADEGTGLVGGASIAFEARRSLRHAIETRVRALIRPP